MMLALFLLPHLALLHFAKFVNSENLLMSSSPELKQESSSLTVLQNIDILFSPFQEQETNATQYFASYGQSCILNEECSLNEICRLNKCKCQPKFFYNIHRKRCLISSYGESCTFNKECGSKEICLINTCKCNYNHFYNDYKERCEMKFSYGVKCYNSTECRTHLRCNKNICDCFPREEYIDHQCIRKKHYSSHSEECSHDIDCGNGLWCQDGACACYSGYSWSDDDRCAKQTRDEFTYYILGAVLIIIMAFLSFVAKKVFVIREASQTRVREAATFRPSPFQSSVTSSLPGTPRRSSPLTRSRDPSPHQSVIGSREPSLWQPSLSALVPSASPTHDPPPSYDNFGPLPETQGREDLPHPSIPPPSYEESQKFPPLHP